ncbi:MAG: protein kinase [Patescibacteria group bacterium]
MDYAQEIRALRNALARPEFVGVETIDVLNTLATDPTAYGVSRELIAYAHHTLLATHGRYLAPALHAWAEIERADMVENVRLLEHLVFQEEPSSARTESRDTVDERFQRYCDENGLVILGQYQSGDEGEEGRSSVFLVLDADGIVKVFKEEKRPGFDRHGHALEGERALHERLGPVPGLSRCYGTTQVDETLAFLRLQMCYGQPLKQTIHAPDLLSYEDACYVIGCVAKTLAQLHAQHIVFLDIRSENVLVHGSEVTLIDLGDARTLPSSGEVATHVHDASYAPPEVVVRGIASTASDIFQLGVLFHMMLTGLHPLLDGMPSRTDSEDGTWVYRTLSNALVPFSSDQKSSPAFALITQMLEKDPAKRPTAEDVARALCSEKKTITHTKRTHTEHDRGTVLFPARMGVPHRGHIDFMARLLELGYKLLVSLGASYIKSERDPLPKPIVLKIVGHALEAMGFDLQNVRFLCTPLYYTDEQAALHYALLPGREDIVAVASGNEEVHALFVGRYPIIDQRTVFGVEGEAFETRSWGERLRHAIRTSDDATFCDLIAPGAEEILSFQELRRYCVDEPDIDFAWGHPERGHVFVQVEDAGGGVILKRRVGAYSTPEDTAMQALGGTWVSRFARWDSVFELREWEHGLRFLYARLDDDQNEIITYYMT